MSVPSDHTAATPTRAYEPPALTVLGSVEAITLSSVTGSLSDNHGRISKHL